MRIIVDAAPYFLIVFGVGLLLPFHPKRRDVSPESDPGFDCRAHAIFFLSLPLEVAIRSFAKWQQRF
jgi:hypothetical protein